MIRHHLFCLLTALLQAVSNNPVLVKCRDQQLIKRKQLYRWKKMEDLEMPSAIDDSADLPNDEGFERVRNVHFYSSLVTENVTAKLAGVTYGTDHLHGYEEYAKLLGEPEFRSYEFSRWTSNVEFGRQILNGVNPVVIRKCEALPAKFPVTDEMVRGSLNRGLSLQQEIEVNIHVYKYIAK